MKQRCEKLIFMLKASVNQKHEIYLCLEIILLMVRRGCIGRHRYSDSSDHK
jgi:hypothetical protein